MSVRNVPHLALQGVSTDELGHFNGEKCTAPCLQGVSKEFVLIAKANGVT